MCQFFYTLSNTLKKAMYINKKIMKLFITKNIAKLQKLLKINDFTSSMRVKSEVDFLSVSLKNKF